MGLALRLLRSSLVCNVNIAFVSLFSPLLHNIDIIISNYISLHCLFLAFEELVTSLKGLWLLARLFWQKRGCGNWMKNTATKVKSLDGKQMPSPGTVKWFWWEYACWNCIYIYICLLCSTCIFSEDLSNVSIFLDTHRLNICCCSLPSSV